MYACVFAFWGGLSLVLGLQATIIYCGATIGAITGTTLGIIFKFLGCPLSFDVAQNTIYAFGIIAAIITFVCTLWIPKLYWEKFYKYRHYW